MSEWHELKDKDIDIDFTRREVNILVTENYYGNIYLTLTFDQIKRIRDKINADKT